MQSKSVSLETKFKKASILCQAAISSVTEEWKQSKMRNKLQKIPTEDRNMLQKIPYFVWMTWNKETNWRIFSSNNVYKPFQSPLNECMKSRLLQVITSYSYCNTFLKWA